MSSLSVAAARYAAVLVPHLRAFGQLSRRVVRRLFVVLRSPLGAALFCAGVLAPLAAAASPTELSIYLVLGGALTGLVVASLGRLFVVLRPSLGVATAVAATCAASGLLFLVVTAASPVCPGAETRCGVAEVGEWTVVGALFAFLGFLVAGVWPLFRSLWRGVRRLVSWALRLSSSRPGISRPVPAPARTNRSDRARKARKQQRNSRRENRSG